MLMSMIAMLGEGAQMKRKFELHLLCLGPRASPWGARCWPLGRRIGAGRVLADLLEKTAGLLASGTPLYAARLWGAAEAYRQRIGAPMETVSQSDYQHDLKTARAASCPVSFDAAWTMGQALDFDQAADEALEALSSYAAAFS